MSKISAPEFDDQMHDALETRFNDDFKQIKETVKNHHWISSPLFTNILLLLITFLLGLNCVQMWQQSNLIKQLTPASQVKKAP